MASVTELLNGVELKPCYDPANLGYDQELGFWVDTTNDNDDEISLFGFGRPFASIGEVSHDEHMGISADGLNRDNRVAPVTEFRDLPARFRTASYQAKGVGPRLYNNLPAYAGSPDTDVKPAWIGAYIVDLNIGRLHDTRSSQGTRLRRIGIHASRLIRSYVSDLETVVDYVHEDYGNVDAVLMSAPPMSELRQRRRGQESPGDQPAQFVIIRNPGLRLRKVGEFHAATP